MRILTYDIEIVEAILNGRNAEDFEDENPGIVYVPSFSDTDKMHVACVCVVMSGERMPRIYDAMNLKELQDDFNTADLIVSWNGNDFDSRVLRANGITIPQGKSFDLMAEVKRAAGFRFKLDSMSQKNLGYGKTDNGALAPIKWQQGRRAEVINYCLNDVLMTYELYALAKKQGYLFTPKGGKVKLFNQSTAWYDRVDLQPQP